MTDKILTEAFDKMKEIEESDDPFCIGATGDTDNTTGYTAVEETVEEAVEDWAQPTSYEVTDDNGQHFSLHYQDANGQEQGIIEVNGVTVAHFIVGGAGAHSVKIINDDAVVSALESLIVTGNE